MVNSIIFDIGMVLVDFCWQELLSDLGFEGEVYNRVADATTRNPLWTEFDRGTWPTDEMIRQFVANAPECETQIRTFFEHMDEIVVLFDYALPWIRELKQAGFRVYILSNLPELVHQVNLNTNLCFLKEVDGAVLSYQEKLLKPDAAIYQCLCERYGIVPEEAVFLDDRLENVEAARAYGLHAIQFKSHEQSVKELNQYLLR